MANKRIDQLPALSTLGDNDLFAVEQSNTAKKATGAKLATYINNKYGISTLSTKVSSLETAVAGKQDKLTLPLSVANGGLGGSTVEEAWQTLGLGLAAGAGIDRTLSIINDAADAWATGNMIKGVEEFAKGMLHNASVETMWDWGAISSSTGNDTTSTTRIRTKSYIPKSTIEVESVPAVGQYAIAVYDTSGGFEGFWNGTELVYGSVKWFQGSTNVTNIYRISSDDSYEIRLVYSFIPASSTIMPSDGVACKVMAATDETLTRDGQAADAKATGDAIEDTRDMVLLNLNEQSFWEIGSLDEGTTGGAIPGVDCLRTIENVPKGIVEVSMEADPVLDFYYLIFGYRDGSFVGTWNGSGFSYDRNYLTAPTSFLSLPDIDYKLVLEKQGGLIALEDYARIRMKYATDTTLTRFGGAADAKATGDAIANLETSWPASCVTNYLSTSFTGVIYRKIDDYNLEIYGTSTAAYLRYVNVFNGSNQLLTSSTVATKGFPAGKYRFHYSFSGTYGTRMTVIKNTTNSDTIPFYDGDVVDVPVPFGVGIRVPANSNWGTVDSPSYLYFKAEYIGTKDPTILFPTGDQTDRTNEISSTLRAFGKCTLSKGDYYVSGFTQTSGSVLCGCGRDSVLKFSSSSATFGISMKYGSTIKDLKIVGPQGEGWVPDGVATERHGIVLNSEGDTILNRNRITIHNVAITGFDGAGIYMASTGTNVENGANISDCYVYANNYGLDNPKRSEYNRVCNCSFANNHVGVRNIGGNNLFSNCGINGNYVGIVMDATEVDDAYNNSHGTFSCCTINHSIDENRNTTTAIQINGMTSGEVFSGCQIAYGAITIADSKGIHFADCNFLRETPINVAGNDLTLFSGCIFLSAAESPITGGGNVILTNCYYRNGTPRT